MWGGHRAGDCLFFLCFLTIVKERAGVNKKSFWEVYGGGVTHRRDV
jgi:hypothetical protein